MITLDPKGAGSIYQGIVALDGQGLEAAAHQYFRQSEQIPTLVRLAVAELSTGRVVSLAMVTVNDVGLGEMVSPPMSVTLATSRRDAGFPVVLSLEYGRRRE